MARRSAGMDVAAALAIGVSLLVLTLFGGCDAFGLLVAASTLPSMLNGHEQLPGLAGVVAISVALSVVPIGFAVFLLRWGRKQLAPPPAVSSKPLSLDSEAPDQLPGSE